MGGLKRNDLSEHEGCPVLEGEKFAVTLFFRSKAQRKRMDPDWKKTISETARECAQELDEDEAYEEIHPKRKMRAPWA